MCDAARDLVALIRANRRNDRRAADRAFTKLAECGFRLTRGSDVPAPKKSTR